MLLSRPLPKNPTPRGHLPLPHRLSLRRHHARHGHSRLRVRPPTPLLRGARRNQRREGRDTPQLAPGIPTGDIAPTTIDDAQQRHLRVLPRPLPLSRKTHPVLGGSAPHGCRRDETRGVRLRRAHEPPIVSVGEHAELPRCGRTGGAASLRSAARHVRGDPGDVQGFFGRVFRSVGFDAVGRPSRGRVGHYDCHCGVGAGGDRRERFVRLCAEGRGGDEREDRCVAWRRWRSDVGR
mmetsp:Transcript_25626/g.46344  ORF Transcript_25626/g.46344 Transcript_25626/m.46344 type:complete len:236 (+) Transcript_25626:441-1148(+)